MPKQNQITPRRLITLFYLAGKYDIGIRKAYDHGSDGDYKQCIYPDHVKMIDHVKKASLDEQSCHIHQITISFYDHAKEIILYQSNEIPVVEWSEKGRDHIMTFRNDKKYREYLIPDKKIKLIEDAKYADKLNELFNSILNKIQELETKIVLEVEKEGNYKEPKKFEFFKKTKEFLSKLFNKTPKGKQA